jgi:hypothetical protein
VLLERGAAIPSSPPGPVKTGPCAIHHERLGAVVLGWGGPNYAAHVAYDPRPGMLSPFRRDPRDGTSWTWGATARVPGGAMPAWKVPLGSGLKGANHLTGLPALRWRRMGVPSRPYAKTLPTESAIRAIRAMRRHRRGARANRSLGNLQAGHRLLRQGTRLDDHCGHRAFHRLRVHSDKHHAAARPHAEPDFCQPSQRARSTGAAS